jgi:hypothetical protein
MNTKLIHLATLMAAVAALSACERKTTVVNPPGSAPAPTAVVPVPVPSPGPAGAPGPAGSPGAPAPSTEATPSSPPASAAR